jgi:hypothetical protein
MTATRRRAQPWPRAAFNGRELSCNDGLLPPRQFDERHGFTRRLAACREDRRQAGRVQALQWHAIRWRIETFHKILKSGCRVEAAKLRKADRLVNLGAVCCVLSWRTLWATVLNRTAPNLPATSAFAPRELRVLDAAVQDRAAAAASNKGVARYLAKLARLGGYRARASDPPPGKEIVWRGWSRLTDLSLGATVGAKLVGN